MIKNCLWCRRENKRTLREKMSLLLVQKLEDSVLTFTNICLDMARINGIVNQIAKMKVCVIVYACMNSSAIFMNISHQQYTTAFLIASENFIHIRGRPRYVYRDKGSNLISYLTCEEIKTRSFKAKRQK